MDYRNDPNALKLYAFLKQWTRSRPIWANDSSGWLTTFKSVETVSAELMNEIEFNEINLAGVFKSPDGQLIATVVGWVLPWPASLEFQLLVDAITAAAKAKQRNQRGVAAGMTLIAGAVLYSIFTSE